MNQQDNNNEKKKLHLKASDELRDTFQDARDLCNEFGLDPGNDMLKVAKMINKRERLIRESRERTSSDRI